MKRLVRDYEEYKAEFKGTNDDEEADAAGLS
jgi:hypothetical protein